MSATCSSCSESSAQTLFNQRIQELRQEDRKTLEPTDAPEALRANEKPFDSTLATKRALEPGKGQLIDVYA